jgi:hypothetical protein
MSPIIDDLRIEAEIPPRPLRPGSAVDVTLTFSNVGTRIRTIFLIRDESYRFGQSTLELQVGSGPPLVQPPPREGYVPTQADFHQLPPRGKLQFQQTLRIPGDLAPAKHTVHWVYENEITTWPSTPGGNTGGQPIPGIWVGRITDRFVVEVKRGRLAPRGSPG